MVLDLPPVGLGTWQNDDPEQCAETVATALDLGYRHLDTAAMYGNEEWVGEGLRRADVPREEVVVATKVWHDSLAYDDAVESARESRDRLGVDAIDLLYVHWPCFSYDPEETMAAFDDLRDDGVVRAVGVSNFEPRHLDAAREHLDAPIAVNQVECHPLLPQADLRDYCADAGIRLVAYSPLIHGDAFEVDELGAVAEKHGVSVPRVTLAWLREKGVAAVPKATGREHLRDNLASVGLSLDPADVERVDAVGERRRSSTADWTPF